MKYRVVSEWFGTEPTPVTLGEFLDYVRDEWGYTPKLRETPRGFAICYYDDEGRVYEGQPEFDDERWYKYGANSEIVLVPAP
jgi:hypothetical protein